MDCPQCKKEVNKLTIPLEGKLGCQDCNGKTKVHFLANLGQTVDVYTRKDGSKGRITTGKDWEMSNRRITSEKVVINRVTGKPTQY